MPYRIEFSPNNRAVCKDKRCKDAADKITKGELRFGTLVEINGHQSWSYKHWGCVTPQQIKNLNDFMEGQWELLEGLEDLPQDIQTKVHRACGQGHVDDEEWKWDPEVNRPGIKRVHKKKPKANIGDNEDAANETVEEAVKAAAKKPGAKKSKKRARDDEEQQQDGEAASPPKKSRTKAKAKVEPKLEDEEKDVKPKANEKKSRKSNAKAKEEANVADEVEAPKPKKRANNNHKATAKPEPVKKSRKTSGDSSGSKRSKENAVAEAPTTASKRGRKKKA